MKSKDAVVDKIKKIMHEGVRGRKVSQRQAVAVALSMQRRGRKKKAIKNYKTVVDRKLPYYGEADFEKKLLKVNPKKGEVVNTVIHEKLHMAHPKMSEKAVRRKAEIMEKKTSLAKQAKMLTKLSKLDKAAGKMFFNTKKSK